jgi:hypothetical protein
LAKTRELAVAEWRDGLKAFGATMSRAITPAVLQAMAEDFPAALLKWRWTGDSKKLVAHLRSGRMTEENLEDLAQALEGKFDLKPERGRPQDRAMRAAALSAAWFLKRWRRINQSKGINDWGHRAAMQAEAVHIVIKMERYAVDADRVLEFLQRPNSRRNG